MYLIKNDKNAQKIIKKKQNSETLNCVRFKTWKDNKIIL